jgi:hypothetical protein
MKKTMMFGPLMMAMLLSAGTASSQGLPSGSYQQTCSNAALRGGTLTATCKRFNGSTLNTELPYATSCVGTISNVDGNLVCTGPVGSYAETCKDAEVKDGKLFASCKRINSSWNNSSTGFSGFQHPVTNCDGNLVDRPNC